MWVFLRVPIGLLHKIPAWKFFLKLRYGRPSWLNLTSVFPDDQQNLQDTEARDTICFNNEYDLQYDVSIFRYGGKHYISADRNINPKA